MKISKTPNGSFPKHSFYIIKLVRVRVAKKPANTEESWYNHGIFPEEDETASDSHMYSPTWQKLCTQVTFSC